MLAVQLLVSSSARVTGSLQSEPGGKVGKIACGKNAVSSPSAASVSSVDLLGSTDMSKKSKDRLRDPAL